MFQLIRHSGHFGLLAVDWPSMHVRYLGLSMRASLVHPTHAGPVLLQVSRRMSQSNHVLASYSALDPPESGLMSNWFRPTLATFYRRWRSIASRDSGPRDGYKSLPRLRADPMVYLSTQMQLCYAHCLSRNAILSLGSFDQLVSTFDCG